MDKDTTLQIKGLLIMMMLWLHLFMGKELFDGTITEYFHWFNGNPLSYQIAKKLCSMCVPFYIFLSGYGLAKVYQKRAASGMGMGNGKRVAGLYIRVWAILAIFVPLGCIFNPALFPGSWATVVESALGISTLYNGAWWFLLPYSLLAMSSPRIIRHAMNTGVRGDAASLLALLALSVGGYEATSKIDDSVNVLLMVLVILPNTLYLSFMFYVGILFVKHGVVEKAIGSFSPKSHHKAAAGIALAALVACRMCLGSSSLIHIPFVPLLIVALSMLLEGKSSWLLKLMGRHSTNMWLCHYFFITYVFTGHIYRLQYPVAIFAALIAVSLATSYIVDRITAPIISRIRK